MNEPRVLVKDLAYVESPRWHDGRLWFPHWGTPEILAVDLDGNVEVVARGPSGMGHSIGWLADGRMFVTGDKFMRYEPDGSMVEHIDLSGISPYTWSESTLDGRGNLYLNSIGYDFMAGEPGSGIGMGDGVIALVTPDGVARQVADNISFPNGMVVTPDNKTLVVSESFTSSLLAYDIAENGDLSNRRVWAQFEGLGPDGICMDADGAIWTSSTMSGEPGAVRVSEGGGVVDRIPLDRPCFACGLGGPDRRTLFMMCADWGGASGIEENIQKRTGQVLVVDAPAPGAGWP